MSAYELVGMRRFLDLRCAKHADAVLLRARDREWSYGEAGGATDAAAAGLVGIGLRPRERVAMLLPTGPDHVLAWLAVVKAGAVACPIHPDFAPAEVAAVLDHLDPAALMYDPALYDRLRESSERLTRIGLRVCADAGGTPKPPAPEPLPDPWSPEDAGTARGGTGSGRPAALAHPTARFHELLDCGKPLRGVEAAGPDDLAEILTTSGTTGRPKAAMIPHRMPVLTGEAFASWLGLTAEDRLFTCLPMSHINARHYSTMGAIAAGGSLSLEERFSASRYWGWLAECGATQFNAIGAMLHILLARPEAGADRAHRVRLAYSAPALGTADHLAFERRFGLKLTIGYGLTESTFGFIQSPHGERNLDSMGRPRGHVDPSVSDEARLVVEETPAEGNATPCFRDSAPGEAGEIWLRNPATFIGYFRDEEQTRGAFHDGWLRTGDLARRDADGNWIFIGRTKQVIRRRGENLTPGEVEAALQAHPAVAEAAVVGAPSSVGEEEVRAYVALRAGASANAQELSAFCAGRIAAFKVPTQWRFVDRLPRTPTQRIAYHLLPRD